MNLFDGLFDSFFSSDRLNLIDDNEHEYRVELSGGETISYNSDSSNRLFAESMLERDMYKKTVLFIGGPKDGKVETVNHPEIECYIQPEIDFNPNKHYEEKTLVVDKEGNEQWIGWDSDDEPIFTEPELFRYVVLRLSVNNEYYSIAINKEIYNEIKQEFHSSIFFDITMDWRFYKENVSNKLDTDITYTDIIANDKCRIKGLWQQIQNSDYSEAELTEESLRGVVDDLYVGTTAASHGFQPRIELEESETRWFETSVDFASEVNEPDFNSRIVRSTPELEQEQNNSGDN